MIQYLREKQPDIAGFCEMWMPEERMELRRSLSEIYHPVDFDNTFCTEGPFGDTPLSAHGITDPLDGGMLLLSKHPIIARAQYIYNSCAGEDCFSAKGALFARIAIPTHPTMYDIFLTHTQSCPTTIPLIANGEGDGCGGKKAHQLKELNNFIGQWRNGAENPCLIMGDFNLSHLENDLGNPVDLWEVCNPRLGNLSQEEWEATGFTTGGDRPDHFYALGSARFEPQYNQTNIKCVYLNSLDDTIGHEKLEPQDNDWKGRISDHRGLLCGFSVILEKKV
jgi:hypothetical protein